MSQYTFDDTDFASLPQRSGTGAATVLGAPAVAPERAVQALKAAPGAGVSADVAAVDPAAALDMARLRGNTTILKTSPSLASWAQKDGVKVAATQDDFPALGKLGQAAQDFVAPIKGAFKQTQIDAQRYYAAKNSLARDAAGGSLLADVGGALLSPVAGAANVLARPIAEYGPQAYSTPDLFKPSTWFEPPRKLNEQQTQAAVASSLVTSLAGLGATGRLADAAAFTHTPEGFPRQPGPVNTDFDHPITEDGHVAGEDGKPMTFESQKDAAQWILKKGYANKANPQIFDVANGDAEGTYFVKQMGVADTVEGEAPLGASVGADTLRNVQAAEDLERAKSLETLTGETQTHARLPTLAGEFVNNAAPGTSVWVSPEKLLETYRDAGKVPDAEDGIFGHIPGFREQFAAALETGHDVQLSLGDYLSAASGKPWADSVREGTRFREDGVSVEEGKTLGEPKETELKASVPPEDITPEEHERAAALAQAASGAVTKEVKSRYLNALFEDAKAAGMTKDQFNRYSDKVEKAVNAAHERLLARAYNQIRRERRPDWQEKLAQNKAAVEQQMFDRPDIQASFYLRYGEHPTGAKLEGPIKLDKASVTNSYPGDLTSRLPDAIFGKNGAAADDLAELFGYESGDAMLRDLARLEDAQKAAGLTGPRDYLKKVIAGQAHRLTGEELGFDLTPANIQEAASEAVSSPEVEALLVDELHQLADEAGVAFSKEEVAERSQEIFNQLPVKLAINLKEFERVIGRTGRMAEVALLKGDYVAAFRAKQQQLINHHMLTLAHKLVKDVPKTQAKFMRWARTPSSKNIAQDWMNQVHSELGKLGYNVKRDPAELAEQLKGESLGDFIDRKSEAGAVIAGEGPWPEKPLKDMTVGEYENAKATISSLVHNGRIDAGVVILGRRAAFSDIVTRVRENGLVLGNRLTPERIDKLTAAGAAGRIARNLNAPMIRPEQLMDEMDRNDALGPLNQSVIYPLQDAKGWENDQLARVTKELNEFAKTQPKDWLGSWKTKIGDNETGALRWQNAVTGTSEPVILTRGNMIRVMLNLGNKGNCTKLLEGYGWDEDELQTFLDRNATKADWDFVQKWWDLHESLWPRIASTYRNLSGIAPKRVLPTPVRTQFGTYSGGYFPITYDKLRAPEVKTMSTDSLWGDDYQSSLPANGYTKGRTGYVAPVALNFSGLNSTLGQIIHDLAFREALSQANRVLGNNDIRSAIQHNFGPSYSAQLRPWLEYTARERVFDDRAAAGIENYMSALRSNITFVGLAYRASSVMIHGDVALSDSIGEVGAVDYAKAVARLWQTPAQHAYWMKYVSENSPEVRNRLVNMDQNVREAVQRMADKQGFLDEVQKFGFHMLALSDNLSAIPTWMAAVEQEVTKGRSPEEAFQIADKRVRNAHGSSAPVDLPAIQRGGQGFFGQVGKTTIGMFLSFMNHNYNRIWGIGRQAGKGFDQARAGDWAGATRDWSNVAARSLAYIIVPAITVTGIKRWLKTGNPVPHTFTDWIDGVAHATFGGLPGVSQVIEAVEKHDTGQDPLQRFLVTSAKTVSNAWYAATGHHNKVSKRWLSEALETAGYWTGKVPGQAGTTGQFLWNVATGAEHPKDFNQFIRGVLAGPKPKGKK